MASHQTSVTVGNLMARFRAGDRDAVDQLVVLLYPELRRLAAIKMNGEASGHSWQPSQLVNELYLHLIKVKSLPAAGKLDCARNGTISFTSPAMSCVTF